MKSGIVRIPLATSIFFSPMLVYFLKHISNKHAAFEFQISRPERVLTGQTFLIGKTTI